METKNTLIRFLKSKRAYRPFQFSVDNNYGLTVEEFIRRIGEDDLDLVFALLAKEDISEQRRRMWKALDQQWQNYLMIVKRGIKIR